MAAVKKNGNDNKVTVTNLLKALSTEKDQEQKKVIRRALRKLGHKGGLRKPKPTAKSAVKSHKKVAPKPETQGQD